MKSRELRNLGIPAGEPITLAVEAIQKAGQAGTARGDLRGTVKAVAGTPDAYLEDPVWGKLAKALTKTKRARTGFHPGAHHERQTVLAPLVPLSGIRPLQGRRPG